MVTTDMIFNKANSTMVYLRRLMVVNLLRRETVNMTFFKIYVI